MDYKNKTFRASVLCALKGVGAAFRTEKNFKYYFGILIFFLIVNLLCHISIYGHVIFIVCCGGVFSAEMLNTAIEHIANMATTEPSEEIRIIKDIAAGGVVLWGVAFFLMEGVFIWHHFF